MIRNVFLVQGDAADVAAHLRAQGKHPRIYTRHARAENLTVTMWVVVADSALASLARKAEKQYRLAAWVLKRIYDGREEHDARVAAETAAAEEKRIAALPRVNCWGR